MNTPLPSEERVRWRYMNAKQILCYNVGARDTRVKAARRFGKTDGTIAPFCIRITSSMPQGAGLWVGNSRKQLFTRTVPATNSAIERMFNLKEGRDFWWGQPPAKLGIPKPIVKPKDWSHVISFKNGFVWHLISLEVKGSANSMTVNSIIADEARFLRKEKLDAEVMPTLSGITHPTNHPGFTLENPYYKSTLFVSDAALTQRESWLEKEEEKCTKEIQQELERISNLLTGKNLTPKQQLEAMIWLKTPAGIKKLNKLRSQCFAYFSFSTLDNIDVLGKDYILKMKRDLPPVVFAISILNLPKIKTSDGFYSNLNIEKYHGYTPDDCPAIEMSLKKKIASRELSGSRIETDYETVDFAELQSVKNCTLDGDLMPFLPLEIAFDYNANINWVVTGQEYTFEGVPSLMTLSSMYVKNERKLRELCQDWCKYYAPHKSTCNVVHYYYDATAKQGSYAIAGVQAFWEVVMEELTARGWNVVGHDLGRPMEHPLKHKEINDAFRGVSNPYPRFNEDNNKALIVAMENTGVRVGTRGFEKDKSKEKYVETEFDPLELRTDGTDAWDTLFLGVKFYKSSMLSCVAPRVSGR